jgi:hypothetical protein
MDGVAADLYDVIMDREREREREGEIDPSSIAIH